MISIQWAKSDLDQLD